MEHPSILIKPTDEEWALFDDIIATQRLPRTTTIKEFLYDELFYEYYKNAWEQAYVEYTKSELSVPLDASLNNVFLSEKARTQFENETEEFRLLFVGWMQSQLENQMTPYFSGQRVDKNRDQWIYSFGKIKVLASIRKQKVTILAFDKTTNEELLRKMLEEEV